MAYSKYLENEGINISSGLVLNTSHVHKFGAAAAGSAAGTVWDGDGAYPWTVFNTPGTLTVTAVDPTDNGHDITICGLDINGLILEETTTVGGVTINQFSRVYRAFLTSSSNTDDVDIKLGGVTVAKILAGKGQTLMAVYSVPSDHTAYLTQGTTTIGKGGDTTIDMFVRFAGQNVFRIGHSAEVTGEGGQYTYKFTTPIMIPGGSDIDIRYDSNIKKRITAAFDLILVKN